MFLDQATKSALRLKAGEDFQGWKLLSVPGREATLERDRQTTILRLQQPDADGDGQARDQAGTEVTRGNLGTSNRGVDCASRFSRCRTKCS
jgi:hypothetical protein